MVDEGYGEAINIAARKWPKSADGFVYVPFSFPPTASDEEKSAIARTVTEFKNKTCIRYDLSILGSPLVFLRNINVVIKLIQISNLFNLNTVCDLMIQQQTLIIFTSIHTAWDVNHTLEEGEVVRLSAAITACIMVDHGPCWLMKLCMLSV